MDAILLGLTILALMTISLIAIHLWIGIWDGFFGLLKKIFHIGRKDKINWHTLDNENQTISTDDTKSSVSQVTENERLH